MLAFLPELLLWTRCSCNTIGGMEGGRVSTRDSCNNDVAFLDRDGECNLGELLGEQKSNESI